METKARNKCGKKAHNFNLHVYYIIKIVCIQNNNNKNPYILRVFATWYMRLDASVCLGLRIVGTDFIDLKQKT